MTDPWLTFPNGSANACRARVAYGAMNQLSREWMFWTAAAVCALAEGAIILSSVRSLRRADGKRAARETMWAVLPAIALAWLLAATWTEVRRAGSHEGMTMPMQMTMPMPMPMRMRMPASQS